MGWNTPPLSWSPVLYITELLTEVLHVKRTPIMEQEV
jgi:hypothetical protein